MLILSTKLKNAINKQCGDMPLQFTLKNITINGAKRGCSGFVRNLDNNTVVYVDTEEPCLSNLHYMYRYADHEKDWTGYRNRWADTLDALVYSVCRLLKSTPQEQNDRRV